MTQTKSSLLQETYVQKSRIFLFPLIGIANNKHFRPTNTYIMSENLISDAYPNGISFDDEILIVVYSKSYKKKDDEIYKKLQDKLKRISSEDEIPTGWEKFENDVLLSNQHFLAFHENEEEFIYTFDMYNWHNDWSCFLKGRYSLFSENAKNKVIKFRWTSLNPIAQRRLYCFLYPDQEDCIKEFAEELKIDVKDLMQVKELCNKPNLSLETYECLLKQTI